MQHHNLENNTFNPLESPATEPQQAASKPPRSVLEGIFAFPPNRDILGGTAYFIVEKEGNILIDCPAWQETNEQFIKAQGGIRWLFITNRGGIGKAREIMQAFNCEILIQEQEAYLLPELAVKPFHQELTLSPDTSIIWTPGHSPGSSCLYYSRHGGVLFSGRHILPNKQGEPAPLRTSKTFHWLRQIKSIESLLARFTPATLNYICPGASTGFLRGKATIDQAYQGLSELDLDALRHSPALL